MAVSTLVMASCSAPAGDRDYIEDGADTGSVQFEDQMELTLYFPTLSYDPANPESKALLPVTRLVKKTEALARATVTELFRGPNLMETNQYNVGPVITSNIAINDIYIKDGICVIHLDFDGPLFTGLTLSGSEAERMFVRSIVYSLEAVPNIDAVWLFHRGSPWQSESWQYFGPIAVPNRALEYTLYYRNNNLQNFDDYVWERMITPVAYVPNSQDLFSSNGGNTGPFFEIVEKLTLSYDQERGPVLPKGISALQFMLHQGVLTIYLDGRLPVGHQAAQMMIRSLIYTFTELPEIDRVVVFLNGQYVRDGLLVWDDPLGRLDLD